MARENSGMSLAVVASVSLIALVAIVAVVLRPQTENSASSVNALTAEELDDLEANLAGDLTYYRRPSYETVYCRVYGTTSPVMCRGYLDGIINGPGHFLCETSLTGTGINRCATTVSSGSEVVWMVDAPCSPSSITTYIDGVDEAVRFSC